MPEDTKVKILVVHPIGIGPKGKKINLKPGNHEINPEYLAGFDAQAFIASGDLIVLKDPDRPAFALDETKVTEIEVGPKEESENKIEEKEPQNGSAPPVVVKEEEKPAFRRINTKKKGK